MVERSGGALTGFFNGTRSGGTNCAKIEDFAVAVTGGAFKVAAIRRNAGATDLGPSRYAGGF